MNKTQDMSTVTLEKIQFHISERVSSTFLRDMKFESVEDIITDTIGNHLTFYLFGNKVHSEEVDSKVRVYPATMWEELKRDFLPKCLKKRYPVRYSRDVTHMTNHHFHVCPHIDCNNDRKHLDFLMLDDMDAFRVRTN